MTGARPEAGRGLSRRGLRAVGAGAPLRPRGRRWRLRRRVRERLPHPGRAGGLLAALTLPALLGLGCLHTELKESDPAEDAVLSESPARITLTYTTEVQLALSTVEVRATSPGATPVQAGKPAYLADGRHDVIVLPLSRPLGTGGYTVAWTTAGPDGHRLSGDFGFRVELPASAEPGEGAAMPEVDPATPPDAAETPRSGEAPRGDVSPNGGSRAISLGTGIGFFFYLGIVGIIGGLVFRSLVIGQCARGGAPREWIDSATSETASFMAIPLAFLCLTLFFRVWDRTAAFFPDDVAGNLLTVATGTAWAAGWWLHLVGVAVVAVAVPFRGENQVRPTGWKVLALGALLLPVVPVLSGHGWSDGPRAVSAVATYLHLVAAAGWMGALACLLWVNARLGNELGNGTADAPDGPGLAEMVAAFSRVAQVAVAVLLVTGTLKIWTHIDAASELWTTPWGRSLLVKAGVVAAVMALGFYNWRVVRPRLERGGGSTLPACIELLLGVAAVAVTSFLVTQPLN